MVTPNRGDLAFVGELLESGDAEPVIDRRYPLEEVPEAIRYLEAGHASGKVVITTDPAAPGESVTSPKSQRVSTVPA